MSGAAEPGWLTAWCAGPITLGDALARFDALPGLRPQQMTGRWRGTGLPTGHPLDGLLEALGWYGKSFDAAGRADPLLFRAAGGAVIPLQPALMPVALALRWPGLARSAPVRRAFSILRPALRTRGPAARLQMVDFRGVTGTAMVYDGQPIRDHFRRVDDSRVLGLMERRGDPPYLFLLRRDGETDAR